MAQQSRGSLGCIGPHECLTVGVGGVDVTVNRIFELARASMAASPEGFVGQLGEPTLHEIDRGRVGWCEMQAKSLV